MCVFQNVKVMYVMLQSGIIACEALKEYLRLYGYASDNIMTRLWTHQYKDINFRLVVNNFRIKYRYRK